MLVEAGADLTARTEFNRTPLHVALQLRPDLVPLLRELGAQVDAPSAAYLGDVDQLARHLDDGAEPGDRTSGVDLLSWAAFGGAAPAAELLLSPRRRPRHRRAALRRGRRASSSSCACC